jgi:opacity protein-like surface antigen
MTKTKIALAAVLLAVTSSALFAQGFDPNMSNRYPGLVQPNAYGYSGSGALGNLNAAPATTLQSAQVRLQKHGNVQLQAPVLQQRDVALPGTNDGYYDGDHEFNADRFDHASSPFAGGN